MRAIVVDDEPLACRQLDHLLKATGVFEQISAYSDPEKALKDAGQRHPDVAFLDIEMPEIGGIELAERLQSEDTAIQIVFTTAYNEFAVKAFDLNAVDYVLKPIMKGRIDKTIRRLIRNRQSAGRPATGQKETYGIECFESLKFYRLDSQGRKRYIPVKWRTSRARELYAYLLKEHGRFVSKETLIDLLWPDSDPEKANTQLYSTIYQIRKLLEKLPFHHRLVKNDIGYSLDLDGTPIDAEEWEAAVSRLPTIERSNYKEHIRLCKAYHNHYFADYSYLWAESERIRLCQLWLEHAYHLIDFLMKERLYTEALDICQQIDRIEPDDEKCMKYEITLYNQTGNIEGAIRVYEKYKGSNNAMG
ncbi:response regulator [Sporolactobacillus vineae]|uniref:response regulator n=1 Tax=Sporolactobacillus vineae TaxID=444463 RepID=UPI000288F54B|nr:response regulator [Sporolactobacillus vineae]